MRFLDVFNPIKKGIHGLTDEIIYSNLNNDDIYIPLYGGNNQHIFTSRYVNSNAKNKEGKFITIFEGEGIIISLDGSAGAMTYKTNERFALNHHAGFITLKDDNRKKINLKYFSLFMKNHFKSLSVSDGSKTLTLDQIYSTDFELPSYDLQCKIITRLEPVIQLNEYLIKLRDKLIKLKNTKILYNYKDIKIKNVQISSAIKCLSGNPGLTERKYL